ncbi:MAG: hypothetical protein J7K53_04050 [Bacteroidales bacterium]|nr:hypothetical protein [Bacteroidales bacterium]
MGDKQVPLRVMWNVIKTQLPVLNMESTDDLLRFSPIRKEVELFRSILRDMIAFYEEVQDETSSHKYASRKLKDAIDNVQSKLNSIPRKTTRYLPTCLSFLLNKVFIPVSAEPISRKIRKSQVKEIFNQVRDAYQKLCYFSMYATRKPIPQINSKDEVRITNSHWVTGAPTAWYETS